MMKEMDEKVADMDDKLADSIRENQQTHATATLKRKALKEKTEKRKCLEANLDRWRRTERAHQAD